MPTPPSSRLRLAQRAARTTASLSRATGRGSGAVIGGRVLLKVAPDAAAELAAGRHVSLVSGTNGKTTTTALLAAAMGTLGSVATNAEGANTAPGLVTTLADSVAARVVLETDEGWIPWAVQQTRPEAVVLLNLSRDQLSRHHEVGMIAATWRSAIAGVPLAVANADDPDCVYPALATERQIWVGAGQAWAEDSVACPQCGDRCLREAGSWHCPTCGLAKPEPDWWVEGDELVSREHGRHRLVLSVPGDFNKTNAAMAVATAVAAGAEPAAAVAALEPVGQVAGRYGTTTIGQHEVRMLLAKNPAGWLEMTKMVAAEQHPVVLAFNSEGVDGRDPSWLYDVSFRGFRGRRCVVLGRRASDLLVRLLMDEVEATRGAGGLMAALATMPPGPVDVIANYTAFQDARKELQKAGYPGV